MLSIYHLWDGDEEKSRFWAAVTDSLENGIPFWELYTTGYFSAKRNRADSVQLIISQLRDYESKGVAPRLSYSSMYAAFYANLGETDSAFYHLDKMYQEKDPNILYLNWFLELEPIFDTPEFESLKAKIGL